MEIRFPIDQLYKLQSLGPTSPLCRTLCEHKSTSCSRAGLRILHAGK